MRLARALRVKPKDVVALVGGGGKTTLMFRLADELAATGWRVVTTMTTRIFVGQMALAPARLVVQGEGTLLAQLPQALTDHGHVLVAGTTIVEDDGAGAEKVQGLDPALVDRMIAQPAVDAVIIEADGSRRLPFKAPAEHEPVIPASATIVVPMVGLDALGRRLSEGQVHRPRLIADLTGAALDDPITPEMIAATLVHPRGGAQHVPAGARIIPFLNKAEDARDIDAARQIARLLLAAPHIDSVAIGAAQSEEPVREVWTRVGVVILAAGEARRFGELKQVLSWRGTPLVAHVTDQALLCPDVDRVVVAVGAEARRVQDALETRRVRVVNVPDWVQGQSRSVRRGLEALVREAFAGEDREAGARRAGPLGAVLFLLADQPGVSPALLSAIIQRYRETLAPVVAPRYRGQRGNPVLFSSDTFDEFERLEGDIGARPILDAHADEIAWVDWPTPEITQDIDTAAEYRALCKQT